MCGRIGQYLPASYLEKFFRIDERFLDNNPENYNLAPTQTAVVVRFDPATGKRALARMKWGLVPSWSKSGKMDYSTFNAKSEGVEKAASFRAAFKARRCVVPVSNFYEWKKLTLEAKAAKQAYAIARADREPLCLAGLWEVWKGSAEEGPITTFTILTTTPNPKMADLHNRMPVILSPEAVSTWLGEKAGDMAALLAPCPSEWLRVWKVGARVGNVRNNDPALLDEVA